MRNINILILFITVTLNCNSQNYFLKTLYDNNALAVHDAYRPICKTHDNNYVLTTYGFYNSSVYYLIFKIDTNSNVIWSKKIGPLNGEPSDIQLAFDNGFIIIGHCHDFGSNTGYGDMLIIKVDSNGLFQWAKNIRSTLGSEGTNVTKTQDSCYIVTGNALMDYFTKRIEIPLIKIDNNGNVIWSKNIGINQTYEYAFSIKTLHDWSYILSGKIYDPSSIIYPNDAFIIKIGNDDEIIWSKKYKYCDAREIIETNDNGFAFIGTTFDSLTNNQNSLFVKLDSMGNIEFSKIIGNLSGYHYGTSLQQKDNGFYLVSGVNFNNYTNTSYLHLLELNQVGDIIWSNNYFNYSISFGFYGPSFVVDESKIYMGGIINDNAPVNSFPFIFKLDTSGNSCMMSPFSFEVSSGNSQMDSIQLNKSIGDTLYDAIISCTSFTFNDNVLCLNNDLDNLNNNILISIYPNPTTNNLQIETDQQFSIDILNIQGEILDKINNVNKLITIDVKNLSSGIYIIKVKVDNGTTVKKFIKY